MKRRPTPRASRKLIVRLATAEWERIYPGVPMPSHYLFAVRGYYATTMGPTAGNDVAINDDAWFFVTPDGMRSIAANTDPTRYGWNAGAGKPMAVLNPGFWPFYRGAHKGRTPSLRQYTAEEAKKAKVPNDGRFSVTRTYKPGDRRNYQESGYYAINAHSQVGSGTSSEGCQTAPNPEYEEFMQAVWDETKAAKLATVWYGLIDGPII